MDRGKKNDRSSIIVSIGRINQNIKDTGGVIFPRLKGKKGF